MKILHVFRRDLKVSLRQFITVWIMLAPLVLALIIRLATPGILDTPLSLAVLDGEDSQRLDWLAPYVQLERFGSRQQLERRVLQRDDVLGLLPSPEGGRQLVAQGNEPEGLQEGIQMLLQLQQAGGDPAEARVRFHSFGRSASPLKVTLTTTLLLLSTILSGMVITTHIVEERADRTLQAIRVTPTRLSSFVIGKSLLGVAYTLVSALLCVWIAGFPGISLWQLLLIALSSSLISFLVGFLTGLSSDDFITAMAGLKMIMIPALAPVLAIELLSDRWQWAFYWSPFYWAYEGMKGLLTQQIAAGRLLMNAGLVLGLTLLFFLGLYKPLRQRLR